MTSLPTQKLTKVVKVFKNGASQAVRLPAEFRFDQTEVFATLDPATGNIILSKKPTENLWDGFFDNITLNDEDLSFMTDRPLNCLPEDKNVF